MGYLLVVSVMSKILDVFFYESLLLPQHSLVPEHLFQSGDLGHVLAAPPAGGCSRLHSEIDH